MSPFEKKVLRALLYHPTMFSSLIKGFGNHKYAMSTIKKYITGTDFGVEIERPTGIEHKIRFSQVGKWGVPPTVIDLYKKYKSIEDTFDPQYGVHIHIDCTTTEQFGSVTYEPNKYFVYENFPEGLCEYLCGPDVFNYKGMYNQIKVSHGKTAIRFHDYYTTIEYRVIRMPRSWAEFVKSIMVCQYATKMFKQQVKFGDIPRFNIQEIMDL